MNGRTFRFGLQENELSSVITQTVPLECTHRELSFNTFGFRLRQIIINKGIMIINVRKETLCESKLHAKISEFCIYISILQLKPIFIFKSSNAKENMREFTKA